VIPHRTTDEHKDDIGYLSSQDTEGVAIAFDSILGANKELSLARFGGRAVRLTGGSSTKGGRHSRIQAVCRGGWETKAMACSIMGYSSAHFSSCLLSGCSMLVTKVVHGCSIGGRFASDVRQKQPNKGRARVSPAKGPQGPSCYAAAE
jgi:hypothetical protein